MSAGPTRAVQLHSLLLSRTQNMQVFDNDCNITTPNENKTTGGARRIVSIIKLGQHRWHNYCMITNIKHLHVCKLMFKKIKNDIISIETYAIIIPNPIPLVYRIRPPITSAHRAFAVCDNASALYRSDLGTVDIFNAAVKSL